MDQRYRILFHFVIALCANGQRIIRIVLTLLAHVIERDLRALHGGHGRRVAQDDLALVLQLQTGTDSGRIVARHRSAAHVEGEPLEAVPERRSQPGKVESAVVQGLRDDAFCIRIRDSSSGLESEWELHQLVAIRLSDMRTYRWRWCCCGAAALTKATRNQRQQN